MKLERNVKIEYGLHLTEEQALWLRGVMQNPLYDCTPETEDETSREMRRLFFDALEDVKRR